MLIGIIKEARRRRMFRSAATHLFVSWLVFQIAEALFPKLGWGDAALTLLLILMLGLFPVTLLFSWLFRIADARVDLEHGGVAHPPRTPLGVALDLGAIAGVAVVAVAIVWEMAAPDRALFRPKADPATASRLFINN